MEFLTFFSKVWEIWCDNWQLFLFQGLSKTLLFSLITVLFGTLIGSGLAAMKMGKLSPLRWLATAYIEVMRGTPILLQLYIIYLGLPYAIPALNLLPLTTKQFLLVAITLCVNSGAYVSELIRSGIQSVDKGQTEAARCLGLSQWQAMYKIVIPQAVRTILPALGNEFIMIIKESSQASVFFVGELMTCYKIINGATYLNLEPLTIIAIIYFVVTFTLSKVIGKLERRMSVQ